MWVGCGWVVGGWGGWGWGAARQHRARGVEAERSGAPTAVVRLLRGWGPHALARQCSHGQRWLLHSVQHNIVHSAPAKPRTPAEMHGACDPC